MSFLDVRPLLTAIGLFEVLQIPLVVIAVVAAFRLPGIGEPLFARFEGLIQAIAVRPVGAFVGVGCVALALRALALPLIGAPVPMIADETSLFLQAETYLSGTWANQVHLGADFESVFVNLSPTYSSIYPVFRSLPMVLGRLAGLDFWAGVWATMIALAMATHWMLRAWLPARYALVGALLVVIRFGVFSYWVNSYWGGAFTALGGVMLLGGYRRLTQGPTLLAGACVGLGVVIMMTTRPYEGLLFSAPFGVSLLARVIRAPAEARKPLLVAGLLAGALVGGGAVVTAIDDQAVTGDWRLAPYTLYRQTTAETPAFLFERRNPQAHARYDLTRAALDHEKEAYDRARTVTGWLTSALSRLFHDWNFYVGVALAIPFAVGLAVTRRGLAHLDPVPVSATVVLLAGLSVETWDFPHYCAPAFGVFMLVIVEGLRRLRRWRPADRPVGVALGRLLPLTLTIGLWLPVTFALVTGGEGSIENDSYSSPCCAFQKSSIHQAIEGIIDGFGDNNIVIVHVRKGAAIPGLIVYNHADIDHARDIWINEDAALNGATLRRFPGRRIWRLEGLPGGGACLSPAPGGAPASAPASRLSARRAFPGGWTISGAGVCRGGFYRPL